MRMRVTFARSPEFADLIRRADELIASANFHSLKDEGRTRAGTIDVAGAGPIFIKRVEARTTLAALAGRMKRSRAARAIEGAKMLEVAGFLHPEPLAAGELLSGASIRATYLITRALPDAQTFSRFALSRTGDARRDFERRRKISDAVATEISRLHDAGIHTRDMQETNLMIAEEKDGFRVYFIDLEDFRRLRLMKQRSRLLNLLHLDRSIGRFVNRAGRLRFLRGYQGEKSGRQERRSAVGMIMKMRAEAERASKRRRPR